MQPNAAFRAQVKISGRGGLFKGQLDIQSTQGKGTSGSYRPAIWCYGQNKVLIVDDHPMVLEGIEKHAGTNRFCSWLAWQPMPMRAMELLKAAMPDIVITDINMPEISGIEHWRCAACNFPGVKVIAMSTFKATLYSWNDTRTMLCRLPGKSASRRNWRSAAFTSVWRQVYMSLIFPVGHQKWDSIIYRC